MAKIAFLQSEYEDKLGVLSLISFLRAHDHDGEIFIESRRWFDEIKNFKPDLIGFSCLTGGHLWVELCAKKIKKDYKWDIPIIVGGSHPTFFPLMIESPYIDFICRGEGEHALKELLDRLDDNADLYSIANIWTKKDGSVIKNDVRPLIEDLDTLPFPDRSHYKKYPFLKHNPHKRIIVSRGCPFQCTYCYNSAYKRLYLRKGKIVRRRSVENVMKEITVLKDTSSWKTLEFVDDCFLADKDWVLEFAEAYRKKINLPYTCFGMAINIDNDIAIALKRSNCKCVEFGIEAGNEYIRRALYKKNIRNEDILRTGNLLHKHHIKFLTFNMVGAPFETIDQMAETIYINQKIKTDYPWCSIMQPYPGTEIFNFCVEKGLINSTAEINSFTYFEKSILKQPAQKTVENVHRLFFLLAKFPALNRFYKSLVSLPLTPLYTVIFYICYAYSLKKRYNVTVRHLLRYWIKLKATQKLTARKNNYHTKPIK